RLQRYRILERHPQTIGDVGTFLRRSSALSETPETPAGTAAAPRRSSEQAFEKVAEIGIIAAKVEVLEPGSAWSRARMGSARPSRISAKAGSERHLRIAVLIELAAIILRALVLVRQEIIGVSDLAEALGCIRIILVTIGMKLFGETAIGLLDFGLA